MNENLNKFMNVYNFFRKELSVKIKSIEKSLIIKNSEDCYIIEESWINDCMENYNNKDNKNLETKISFPKTKPNVIKDFNSIIAYFKKDTKLKLINKKSLLFLFSENDLINIPIIEFYGGNNKIILEYKDNRDGKALLINYPLDQNSIKDRIFIIYINEIDKSLLYYNILSEKNNLEIFFNPKIKKYLMSFEKYLNILNNSYDNIPHKQNNQNLNNTNDNQNSNDKTNFNYNNQNNNFNTKNNVQDKNNKNNTNESFKKEILKILIYYFYYKRHLIEHNEKTFNENKIYYLINLEWFDKYLEYYDYQKLKESLTYISNKYPKINYSEINKYIKKLIDSLLTKDLINFEKEKFKDLSDIQKIFPKKTFVNNNLSFNNCYIIPSDIIEIISKCEFPNKKHKIYQKKIYVNNKDLYFKVADVLIIIGNINKDIFIPKYILYYNSQKILESEKNIISSNKIEDYIKLRGCDINKTIIKQDLFFDESIIGQFIKLNYLKLNNQKKPSYNSIGKKQNNNRSENPNNNKKKINIICRNNSPENINNNIDNSNNKNNNNFQINNQNNKQINFNKGQNSKEIIKRKKPENVKLLLNANTKNNNSPVIPNIKMPTNNFIKEEKNKGNVNTIKIPQKRIYLSADKHKMKGMNLKNDLNYKSIDDKRKSFVKDNNIKNVIIEKDNLNVNNSEEIPRNNELFEIKNELENYNKEKNRLNNNIEENQIFKQKENENKMKDKDKTINYLLKKNKKIEAELKIAKQNLIKNNNLINQKDDILKQKEI